MAAALSSCRVLDDAPRAASVGTPEIIGDAVPGASWATLTMKTPAGTGVIAGPGTSGLSVRSAREVPRGDGAAGSRRGMGGRRRPPAGLRRGARAGDRCPEGRVRARPGEQERAGQANWPGA